MSSLRIPETRQSVPQLPRPSLPERRTRTLIWDVERGPTASLHFGVWKVDIRRPAVLEEPRIFCWSWSWLDEDAIHFMHEGQPNFFEKMHGALDEADRVVSFNGIRADTRWAHNEFVTRGLGEPSPCKQIDLFRIAKRKFDFMWKGLDDIARELGLSRKMDKGGWGGFFELWKAYTSGDEKERRKALSVFRQYSIQDTLVTKEVFHALEQWI